MRRLGLFAVSLAALIAAGLAGALISGHINRGHVDTGHAAVATTTTARPDSTTTTTVPHSGDIVEVANGTIQPGAAAYFTQILQSKGWATATPLNATSPVTASSVYYAPGKEPAALLAATQLGIAPSAVQPINPNVPLGTTLGLDVVVIIGPDLASRATAPAT